MQSIEVVCAIDVNDFDQQVVDLAAEFARSFDCDLDLVHVTLAPDPGKAVWPAFVGAPDELTRDHQRLQQVETGVPGVQVRHHHLSGLPGDKIIEFAREHEPELLVLGTHARTGISRIFGSVAAHIMRSVACPVMVYRQQQHSRPAPDDQQSSG